VSYPPGHARNAMSDDEVDAKFRAAFAGFGSAAQADRALRALWAFDTANDVASDVLSVLETRTHDV
jgi:2-methylcitrate dehydratase PrpD